MSRVLRKAGGYGACSARLEGQPVAQQGLSSALTMTGGAGRECRHGTQAGGLVVRRGSRSPLSDLRVVVGKKGRSVRVAS